MGIFSFFEGGRRGDPVIAIITKEFKGTAG